jgi:hypothetical protein
MGVGILLEKGHPPSRKEMERVVGPKAALFRALLDFMSASYQLEGERNFGGKNYGWNLWYRKRGKTLVNVFPQKGYFVAQVVLGKEQVEKVSALTLEKNVQGVFRQAPQYHDGRWMYIPVKTKRDVQDVQSLIRLKRKPVLR